MRITKEYVKMTLKEDAAHVRALVLASEKIRNNFQAGVLRDVRKILIRTNMELTPATFRLYRQILDELGIPLPALGGKPEDGPRYSIPEKDKKPEEHATALAKRRKKRRKAFDAALADADMDEVHLDFFLEDKEPQDRIFIKLQERTEEWESEEIAKLRAKVADLERQLAGGGGSTDSTTIPTVH